MSSGDVVHDESLGEYGYRRLRRATRTYREELVLRLGGEVGLRPAEMARLRPADVETRRRDGRAHRLVNVPAPGGGADRTAYLPPDVGHDLDQYVTAEDLADDDPLFSVSPRRLQMIVSEVGDRAAERTGDRRLAAASSRSLRRYFARRLLVEEGVDPRVVQAVGGWDRLASLEPYLDAPDTDDLVAAFRDTTLVDTADRTRGTDRDPEDGDGVFAAAGRDGGADPRLDPVLDAVRDIGDALAGVSTPAEVTETTCRTLAASDAYAAAWFAEGRDGDLSVTAAAGDAGEAVRALGRTEAVDGALADGEVRVSNAPAADDGFAGWAETVSTLGLTALAVVPVGDGGTTHGALCLGVAEGRVEDHERAVLHSLGTVVGSAITAAQRHKLLLADTVVELELRSMDADSFFVALSDHHGCTVELEGVVPGEDRSLVYFVTVSDAPAEAVLGWASDHDAVGDARLVRDHGDEALLEVGLVGEDCSKALISRGGTVREMSATDGTQRVVGDVSADADIRGVLDALTDRFPATELVTKRERERPVETTGSVGSSLRDALTEKQAAVLQAAYHAGYFEWPRGSTAEELADAIGITSPTLHNHLRRAQQKLLSEFFAGEETPLSETPWTE